MKIIEIQTLIDITSTGVMRPTRGQDLEYAQNRNFITLKQCAEIRSNITFDTGSTVETVDIKELGFGSKYRGKQKVWTFRFSPDRVGVYDDQSSDIGALIGDIDQVPVIKNLQETINIEKAMFDLTDPAFKNTIVKALHGTI
jgi:hypothetical protein